jgi:UDP-N-acetylmuramoyl-tripeptide--D-alanyl-D-alanine ligase
MHSEHKMVILGDMLELGGISEDAHKEIIELVIDYNFEAIFIGEIFASFKSEYSKGMFFKHIEDARSFISIAQPKNNLVLLKGSRGIGLERLEDLF